MWPDLWKGSSTLPILMIHDFRLTKAIALNLDSSVSQHRLTDRDLYMVSNLSYSPIIGSVWKIPICKSIHISYIIEACSNSFFNLQWSLLWLNFQFCFYWVYNYFSHAWCIKRKQWQLHALVTSIVGTAKTCKNYAPQ